MKYYIVPDIVLDKGPAIRYVGDMGRGPAITMQDVGNIMAAKLLDPTMPNSRVGAIVGRSDETVSRVSAKFEGVIAQYRALKQRQIVDDLDIVRRGYLAHMADPVNIEKCSSLQAATVFGILTDKLLLESGRPTAITLNANADISLPDVLGRLQKAIQGRQATISGSGQVDE